MDDDEEVNALFEVVVMIYRLVVSGRRSAIRCRRSPMVVAFEVGKQSVDGSPSPGKVVSKTSKKE